MRTATKIGSLAAGLLLATASLAGAPARTDENPPAPDNTEVNRTESMTAQDQGSSAADRETTRKIRAAVVADKGLSTYAHNVKIITKNGQVTLKGPVSSADEKSNVEAKAAEVVGAKNVTNEITVTPPKS
jgi:osmotically-inducible protein OsmY